MPSCSLNPGKKKEDSKERNGRDQRDVEHKSGRMLGGKKASLTRDFT